ncbi:MAG: DNA topoisomerase IB [Cyclobacteriaceae bacterium]|nr:DNA topoisomerase IB [Cyclobacteriaceae bacterium]
MNNEAEEIDLSHKEFLTLDKDYESAASAANLVYLKDNVPGILRKQSGKGFSYSYKDKSVTDEKTLARIKKLAIPPAWTDVWISPKPSGHIQATGVDVRKRKQYRYHTLWNNIRSQTKFHRLYEFGKALPALRLQLDKDVSLPELNERKVLAAVILLMERTYIRVGNAGYEKMNGSYGLTTLKDKHVLIQKGEMNFSFKGKKGVYHKISLKNKKLAKIVKECRDVPGKELFQYYAADGSQRSIDSGSVNQYIKDASGMDFSAKDFRLWAGSLNILQAFKVCGEAETASDCKKNVLASLDEVSSKLGNTRTVCKKYYVHPGIIKLYEENGLTKYLKEIEGSDQLEDSPELHHDEKILLKILKGLH